MFQIQEAIKIELLQAARLKSHQIRRKQFFKNIKYLSYSTLCGGLFLLHGYFMYV